MSDLLDRLGALGRRYRDPLTAIDWQAAEPDLPWLPLRMLSHTGLGPVSPELLVQFSRIEFARLCAAGLWLEGLLIHRVTGRSYPPARAAEARVILQEVREEAGHGLMFLEMIDRAGLAGVPLLGPTRMLTAVAHVLSPRSAAFWAMVFVGETVTDQFALHALLLSGADDEAEDTRICPVARQVLALHHRDEARHIAAARALLAERVASMGAANRRLFALTLSGLLNQFLRATLYPTPASLAVLGVADPGAAARAAYLCPQRRRLAQRLAAPAVEFLRRQSLVERAPAGNRSQS